MDMDMEKQCFTCKHKKVISNDPKISDFGKLFRSKDGFRSSCKECIRKSFRLFRTQNPEHSRKIQKSSYERRKKIVIERAKKWANDNPEKHKEGIRKSRYVTHWNRNLAYWCKHRFQDVPCEIDADYILSLFKSQQGKCYWLGIPLVISESAHEPCRPSIDRLDNTKGYIKGNVVLASQFANLGRRSTSVERFSEFISQLKENMKNE